MPKIDCSNNRHPLRDDFSMYYRGSYISKGEGEELRVMKVEAIDANDDQTSLEDIYFRGSTCGKDGHWSDIESWVGTEVNFTHPTSGFRKSDGRVYYISFHPANRTNKKGLEIDSIICTPRSNYGGDFIWQLFSNESFPGKVGRDVYVDPDNHKVRWKNLEVGSFKDGVLKLKRDYSTIKELLCKLLVRSSEVNTVEIIDQ